MTREDLLAVNIKIITDVANGVKQYAPKAFCIIVTNPLDAMVYVFHKITGFPKSQVVGMAGTLDTARWRAFVAMELGVSVADVAGTVLGGHGPDMVPLPRLTTVGGVPLEEIATKEQIDRLVTRTREAGTEIVKLFGKGSAFFSPAWSAIVMAESYLKDKRRVLPCAALCEGEYGIKGLFLGVPVLIGAKGIEKIFEIKLTRRRERHAPEDRRLRDQDGPGVQDIASARRLSRKYEMPGPWPNTGSSLRSRTTPSPSSGPAIRSSSPVPCSRPGTRPIGGLSDLIRDGRRSPRVA